MIEIKLSSGQRLKFPIKYSKKRRSIALKIDALGVISLYAPSRVSLDYLSKFVESKIEWIEKHHTKSVENVRELPVEILKTGQGEILIRGKHLILKLEESLKSGFEFTVETTEFTNETTGSLENKDVLLVKTKPRYSESALYNAFKRWMKTQAEIDFQKRLDYWSEEMGLPYSSLEIKNFQKRWGDCSSKRVIRMNWKSMACPGWVRDSLCIHELAHLREMNHSPKFYQLVRRFDLKERESHYWLKKHGFVLNY